MSKKKALSPTASVATCLDFAARVLSSTASVQEICTKPVLAPMVVEAHRYGQQATKHLEPGTSADVRKLLKVLQSSKLSGGSPVAGLDVADLTWDFEGAVADTLEMELEELQDRAAMKTTDTCVVFSASTPVSIAGQAVIWFPLKSHDDPRDEDDKRSILKKQQILLYVCPGRVKVVKSVGELVKKLHDELPSLRERGALYKVWAVLKRDLRTDNQHEHEASQIQVVELGGSKTSQLAVERSNEGFNRLGDPIDSVPAVLEAKKPTDTVRMSAEMRKARSDKGDHGSMNSHIADSVSKDTLEIASQPQQDANFDQEELPPLRPRFTVFKDGTSSKQYPAGSIFSFGLDKKMSTELPLASNQHILQDLGVDENGDENDENVERDRDGVASEETIASCTGDNQSQVSWKKNNVVSSSMSDFSPESYLDNDVGLSAGVRLPQGLAWQSCDGQVLRRSVLHQRARLASDNDLEECNEASEASNQEDDEDDVGGSELGAAEAFVRVGEEPQPSEAEKPMAEKSEQFPELDLPEQVDSLDGDDTIISRFGAELNGKPERQVSDRRLSPEVTTSTEMPTDTESTRMFQASEVDTGDMKQDICLNRSCGDDVSPVEPNDKVELSRPIHTELLVSPRKPKPVPVNYKDKLGARVWWELEYTARKLEREEMMERRQQARISGTSNRATTPREASQQKLGRRTGPQRLEPTGWSKQRRLQRQNEVSVSTEESVDIGLGPPELTEIVADLGDIVSSTTENKAVSSSAILSHSKQGNDKQEIGTPPLEALPSPSPIPTNLRSSKNQFALNEGTGVTPQPATPRQSTEISTRAEIREGAHNLPVQDSESPRDIVEPSTLPPSETSFPPSMQKSIRSFKDMNPSNKNTEAIERPDLSRTEISTTTKYHEVCQNPPRQEDRGLELGDLQSSVLKEVSPQLRDSLGKDKLNERASSEMKGSRQPLNRSSTSKLVVHSVQSSVVRSSFHVEMKVNGSFHQDEDEAAARMMWGSTRTSYEGDHTTYSRQIAEEDAPQVPGTPFTVRGRVPIRTHRDPGKVVVPAEPEAPKAASTSSACQSSSPRGRIALPKEEHYPPSRIKPSGLPQKAAHLQTTPRIPTPPPVVTFIPLVEDIPRSQAMSREERLNELRQKKLRKLQQTRDLSLQQHKEKQNQRQVQKPLSFASSVYSKKASNRQLMQNALEFTLLAGGSMEKERTLALQALAESTCDNFIVLLKSAKELKFRALYENHVERDSATRIYSVLPSNSSRAPLKLGSSEMISQFFKYSSAKKQFLPVPTRSFTVKTDACALVDQLVFKGKSKSTALARLL